MIKISIIIPTRNRGFILEKTLNSLLLQNHQKNSFEIIIIDNNSEDKTQSICNKYRKKYPFYCIRYIFESVPGLISGRHRGTFEAKGDILVFIDDDVIVDKGWLSAIDKAFNDETVYLVGGKNLPIYEVDPPEWLNSFFTPNTYGKLCGYLSLLDFGDEVKEIDPIYVWGLNFSIRKKTLLDCTGFHPDGYPKELIHFRGDGETGLSMKIKMKGYRTIYEPKALVYHWIPKERMTREYFEYRQFIQGISGSFTELRTKNGKYPQIEKPKNTIRSRIPEPVKKPLRFVKNLIIKHPHHFALKQSPEEKKLKEQFQEAYQRGYDFHQRVVKKNPELLKWVLKDDYWDYRLPELYKKGNSFLLQEKY